MFPILMSKLSLLANNKICYLFFLDEERKEQEAERNRTKNLRSFSALGFLFSWLPLSCDCLPVRFWWANHNADLDAEEQERRRQRPRTRGKINTVKKASVLVSCFLSGLQLCPWWEERKIRSWKLHTHHSTPTPRKRVSFTFRSQSVQRRNTRATACRLLFIHPSRN